MARTTRIEYTDDLDGTIIDEDAPTIGFALDGIEYDIDLNSEHRYALRALLAGYIAQGRRLSASGRVMTRTTVEADSQTVRQWANSNGWKIASNVRVPGDARAAFDAANS